MSALGITGNLSNPTCALTLLEDRSRAGLGGVSVVGWILTGAVIGLLWCGVLSAGGGVTLLHVAPPAEVEKSSPSRSKSQPSASSAKLSCRMLENLLRPASFVVVVFVGPTVKALPLSVAPVVIDVPDMEALSQTELATADGKTTPWDASERPRRALSGVHVIPASSVAKSTRAELAPSGPEKVTGRKPCRPSSNAGRSYVG